MGDASRETPHNGSARVCVLWDFDTTNVASGGRANAAVDSLAALCKNYGFDDVPVTYFCYTRRSFYYPGREQAITQVRRLTSPRTMTVHTRTEESREQLRNLMRYKLREVQEDSAQGILGKLLVVVSGDPEILYGVRMVHMHTPNPWPVVLVCPHPAKLPPGVANFLATWPNPSYCWDMHYGVNGVNSVVGR